MAKGVEVNLFQSWVLKGFGYSFPLFHEAFTDGSHARVHWEMPETPEIELEDVVKLAEISATTRVQYVRPDEVREILVKMGFELTEPARASCLATSSHLCFLDIRVLFVRGAYRVSEDEIWTINITCICLL